MNPLGNKSDEATTHQPGTLLARQCALSPRLSRHTLVAQDIAELTPALETIANERLTAVKTQLAKRGEEEAQSLAGLLEQQQKRIARAAQDFNPDQLTLDLVPEERREREADRRHWQTRLTRLEQELRNEPKRLRDSYEVKAHRLEPVGIVYLWPVSG